MVTTPTLISKVDPIESLEDDSDYDANVLVPDVFDEIPEGMEAEVASPDDPAEMLFQKAQEYLTAGSAEIWILLPESGFACIVMADQILAFTTTQTIATQKLLPGFAIDLQELFT